MAISVIHQYSHPLLNPSPSSSLSLSPKPLIQFSKPVKCCHNSTHSNTQKTQHLNINVKKRKPKPSFYEQIRGKWSVKPVSQTKKFPWQQPEQQQQQQPTPCLFSKESLLKEVEIEEEKQLNFGDDKLVDATKIEEPITAFGRNLGRNTVSVPDKFALHDGLCISSFVEKTKLVGTHHNHNGSEKQFDVVSEIVDCKGNVEESVVSDIDLEDSEVTLSSCRCDVDDVNFTLSNVANQHLKDNIAKLTSSNVDNHYLKDNIAKVTLSSSESKYSGSSDKAKKDRLPWMPDTDSVKSKTKLAEETIPEHELKRLRNVALRMKERLKVGAAGVTQALVDTIHEKWKIDEVVKLKFEGPSMFNMKRIHHVLESKTGGLVIWRSGSSVVLFRGLTYNLDCVRTFMEEKKVSSNVSAHLENHESDTLNFQRNKSEEELMEINEVNNMLDELGPRYIDWSGPPPLPVDADLLPPVVHGYKTPFRLCPYGVRRRLRDEETTQLRRTARITHPHFALGRSRELQGLAAAMVKLWEKSAIAKIAIKRGVLNTSNERMAEELKRLTGGTLLSRNKEYIVFYRGNDFLPPKVTDSLKERERLTMLQYQEEEARRSALPLTNSNSKHYKAPMVAGTLMETVAATSEWGNKPSIQDMEKMMKDAALSRRASVVKHLQSKLVSAKEKLKRADKALEKVQGHLDPEELPTDLETITDEERLVFRKMGLSMKPFLVVGRREVFDGTIENIHLHWKFRELVKVVVKGKNFKQVKQVAISLEAESGGLLVSIDRTTKGYAIIIYRGKNYRQPIQLRPRNLLTKRQALARSIELQRREGLKHHITSLQEQLELLTSELEDMKNEKEFDNSTFSEKLDNSLIPSDDDIKEDGNVDAFLQIYNSGDGNGFFKDD